MQLSTRLRPALFARAAAVLLLAATGVTATAPDAAAASAERYVALGDSAASGPLVLPQTHLGCARSGNNYAGYVARSLGVASFTDVTCSGADTDDFHNSQGTDFGDVPPQFDALSADTTLVTVHIGANDVNLLDLATDCFNWLPAPFGDPCADDYGDGGQDSWRTATDGLKATIRQVVADVRTRAPQARIFVVGYATYMPKNGCYPTVPVQGGDADYIRATLTYFNDMLRSAAGESGAGYVDLQTPSEGHDACKAPGTRWVEPYIPGSIAAPFHPNRVGMENYARAVLATIT